MPEQEKSSGLNDLGRKLLGLFVKLDPAENTPVSTAPANASMPASAPSPGPSAPSPRPAAPVISPTAEGSVDTKFMEHFAALLEKANQPGPDYFEFRDMLRNLSNLNLNEDQQYQAAWASFKAMAGGANAPAVSVLTNTANQYLTALNNDHDGFVKTADSMLTERVGGLQNEQKQLLSDNESIARQIAELQQKINANNERLSKIKDEIDEQSVKIAQSKNNYEATLAVVTGQIKRDISKIETYLK